MLQASNMKSLKIFVTLTLLFFIFSNSSIAATSEATEYKIKIRKLELCDSSSTQASCNNPVTLYSGNSGDIDIANTTAGSAAASLGNASAAKFGTSYTYIQITMNRAFTLKGSVDDSAGNTCYTKAGTAGTASVNSEGSGDSGDLGSTTLYAAMPGTSHSTALNSLTSLTDTETAGTVTAGDEFFQYRQVLASTFVMEPGNIPSVTVAFGTSAALGAVGNMGEDCDTANASVGMYAAEPDVTITIN